MRRGFLAALLPQGCRRQMEPTTASHPHSYNSGLCCVRPARIIHTHLLNMQLPRDGVMRAAARRVSAAFERARAVENESRLLRDLVTGQ